MYDYEKYKNDFNFVCHYFTKLMAKHFFDLLGEIGVFPGQPPVLRALYKNGECNQNEICRMINIKPGTMTDILKRMEKSGLIQRKPSKNDMRFIIVSLTDKGKETSEKVFEIQKKLEDDCFKGFNKEEKDMFISYLRRINENLYKER